MLGFGGKEKSFIKAIRKGYLGKALVLVDQVEDANMRGKANQTPLLAATGDKDPISGSSSEKVASTAAELVRRLLAKGADPNLCDPLGRSPLMNTAIHDFGNIQAFKYLLDHGADIHLKDQEGKTALMHAAEWQHADMVRILLEKGAAADDTDKYGMTPLLTALQNRSFDCEEGEVLPIVHMLIEARADKTHNRELNAALSQAVGSENPKSVKALLEAGADSESVDTEGMSLLEWAEDYECQELVQYLKQSGPEVVPQTPPGKTLDPDIIHALQELCVAYAQNDTAKIRQLEPQVKEMGQALHERNGITEMRNYFEVVQDKPGARTLEMCWGGIGDWRA